MRKLPIVAAATVVFGLAMALPANAATSGTTTTTFNLNGGPLSISVPASVSLGTGAPGSQLTGPLGATTVSDLRGALVGSWTASVTSSSFSTGGGTAAETISNTNVSYASGMATSATGIGVMTPGQVSTAVAQALSSSQTAYAATATVGNTSAVWNPTLMVAVPASAVVGTYTGTLTHSVA